MSGLLTRSQVADLLEVTVYAVDQWRRRRRSGFPQPAARFGQSPVWDAADVTEWARRTGRL